MKIKYYLEAESWEVFTIIIGSMIVSSLLNAYSHISEYKIFLLILSAFIGFIGLLSWLYTLGMTFYSKRPKSVRLSLSLFRINILFVLVYGFMFVVYFGQFEPGQNINHLVDFFRYIFIFHMYCMYAMLYGFYFVAKAMISVEKNANVDFGKYAGVFFMIWFFPIRIWYLQPRIRKIYLRSAVAG